MTAGASRFEAQEHGKRFRRGVFELASLVLASSAVMACSGSGKTPEETTPAPSPITASTAIANLRDTPITHLSSDLEATFNDGDNSFSIGMRDADGQGVTGMHAMERILFVKTTPDSVIEFEATLPGYKEAAYPSTEDEAKEFKTKLAARLVTDTDTLVTQWTPQIIDLPGAYVGLIDLMNEQREKVLKASTDEEESRYSQRTMHDVRDNLAGTRKIYDLFKPWLESKKDGKDVEDAVESAFDDLNATYDTVDGDAIPQPPADWSSETPTADNLATPFGKLFEAVDSAVDPNRKGSVVDGMTKTANAIGLQVTAE